MTIGHMAKDELVKKKKTPFENESVQLETERRTSTIIARKTRTVKNGGGGGL